MQGIDASCTFPLRICNIYSLVYKYEKIDFLQDKTLTFCINFIFILNRLNIQNSIMCDRK